MLVIILQEELRRVTNIVEGKILLARKNRTAHFNIKNSHLWRKGYYSHTKVQLRYKQRKNRTTCLDHSYDIEYNFTSRFSVGFRGSFICGATNHFERRSCPVGINSKEEIKKMFSKELWYHKSYTKNRNKKGFPVSTF